MGLISIIDAPAGKMAYLHKIDFGDNRKANFEKICKMGIFGDLLIFFF
jgi:voltage-gated potassium channel Kch